MDLTPIVRSKLGKRWWKFLVVQTIVSRYAIQNLVHEYQDHVDIFLIAHSGVDATDWEQDDDWKAVLFEDTSRYGFDPSLGSRCLAIARVALLNRFLSYIGFDRITSEQKEFGAETTSVGRYPRLPDPADVPRFREEPNLDPLGQNMTLKKNAWLLVANQLGQFMAKAHRLGLAVTLPNPPPGLVDLALKPWRAIAPVDSVFDGTDLLTVAHESAMQPTPEDKKSEAALNLVQRYLLTTVALTGHEKTAPDWGNTAALLEQFGYLMVSCAANVKEIPELAPFYSLGLFAAQLHSHNFMHGDMHLGNFSYDPETNKTISFDFGDACQLERPLTALDRARDLTILKLDCTFEQWQAVKVGYKELAPDQTEEVFQLI